MTIEELLESDEFGEIDITEHALLLCLNLPYGKSDTDEGFDALMALEDILRDIMEVEAVGEVDGHEFATSSDEETITYFMYGGDADAMYRAIEPIIPLLPHFSGSYIVKQYGRTSDAKEVQIFL